MTVNDSGLTALHKAAYTGCAPYVIKMLIERKADVNLQDVHYGNTPFHKACEYHQQEPARLMILSADHSIKNKKGKTAFDMASKDSMDLVIEYLYVVDRGLVGVNTIS